jgi:hypothetical protein
MSNDTGDTLNVAAGAGSLASAHKRKNTALNACRILVSISK